jgi:hypothetical protein
MARLVSLDFDPVKEGADVAEGVYQFQVVEANEEVSQSGNPMIALRMTVINDPQFSGRNLFDRIVLIPSVAWKLNQFCNCVGADPRKLDLDEFVGRTGWVVVELDDSGRSVPKTYKRAA